MLASPKRYNQSLIKAKTAQAVHGHIHALPQAASPARLPPGQVQTDGFPILDLGVQPTVDLENWSLEVIGNVAAMRKYTWAQFQELPTLNITADFHCVTRWSKFDVQWTGVPFEFFYQTAQPDAAATFVIAESEDGYSVNVPLHDCLQPNVILAFSLFGQPIPKEHGGPVRLIVPHLYGWKSAKFLRRLRFATQDEPGFWEERGYHAHGDPWREERYQ